MKRALLSFALVGSAVAVLTACTQPADNASTAADAGELNLYSARHYDADEQLYALFEKETGIRLNRIEMGGDQLIERMTAEGAASPADVVLVVDAGNLWRAEEKGLFQPLKSDVLEAAIPANLRDDEGKWFGFAKRARVIAYAKDRVKPEDVQSYADLAKPQFKGKVCQRSSSNIYNLSLMGSLIAHWGEERAAGWARDVVANLAKPAAGNDTENLKAVAAGECDVTLVNHYYWMRLNASDKPEDKAVTEAVALAFPEQATTGTHVNISGGALAANAPNRANAVKFLEFLASPAAQKILADANYEFPVAPGPDASALALSVLPPFKEDALPLTTLGTNQALAQKTYDTAGWK